MASLAARDDCRALLAKGVRVEPLLLLYFALPGFSQGWLSPAVFHAQLIAPPCGQADLHIAVVAEA